MIKKCNELLQAEAHFKNHHASLEILDIERNLAVLNWKEPDTNAYAVRAVMDGEYVYLSGDLGHAIIRLTEIATLKALSNYWKSPSYFIEKIQCSTDLYVYDYETAKAELTERLNNMKEFLDKENEDDANALDELDEAYYAMLNEFDGYNKGFAGASEEVIHQWAALDNDSDDYDWIYSAGRILNPRIWLWLAAFEMAYAALKDK